MQPITYNELEDIARAASGTRVAQKRYFSARDKAGLLIAKTAEKILDERLAAIAERPFMTILGDDA